MSDKQRLDPPTVLVYGDYLDPYTRAACAAVEEAGGAVDFHHLPKDGLAAAVAAEAARELGAFEPMHRALLAHDGEIAVDDLRRYAADAGIEPERFESAFGSDAQMARLRDDVRAAAAAGAEEPPALFLDGERLLSYEPGWLRERLATRREPR